MSDTPKTDAHVRMMIKNDISPEGLEYFARDLERELAAAAIEMQTLRTANAGLVEKVRRLEEALVEIQAAMIRPASNHRLMQIAGPARQVINIVKLTKEIKP